MQCLSFFCALVCHLVSRHRQFNSQTDGVATCSSLHFCPCTLRPRCTTCQPAVFFKRGKKWTNGYQDGHKWNHWQISFFSCSLSTFSLFFFFNLGPLSIQPAAVFIWVRNHPSSIWHLDKVDGQRGEMRADDGERQLAVSGDTHHSPLFPLLYLLFVAF